MTAPPMLRTDQAAGGQATDGQSHAGQLAAGPGGAGRGDAGPGGAGPDDAGWGGAGPGGANPGDAGQIAGELTAHGLAVLASARWTGTDGAVLPPIAGFVMSSFSPLAASVAESCLRGYFGPPPGDPARTRDIAVVLASATGDIGTAVATSQAVDAGRRVPPLLFYQANPNAVVGHIAARWGLAGPVICSLPAGDTLTDALVSATMLIDDGDAAAALVIVANQACAANGDLDNGMALLIGPPSWPAAVSPARSRPPATAGTPPGVSNLEG
jgi:hypothetical protein